MIIYRGFGWLVFVIIIGCALGANLLCDSQLGAKYWDAHKWPLAAALAVAGVLFAAARPRAQEPPEPGRVIFHPRDFLGADPGGRGGRGVRA